MRVDAACRWAWLMAFLSTAALETAADDGESPVRVVLTLAGMFLAVIAGNLLVRRRLAGWTSTGNRLTWILALAGIAFGLELAVRRATGDMWPLELLMLAGFRTAVLTLAIFAHEPQAQRSCCVLSTFLMIFASVVASQLWLQGLVILFAVIGIWWLMESYWNSLTHRLVATSSRGLPRQWMLLLPLLLAGCLLAIPLGGESLRAMAGFMPSSGGTDWYSEAARSGVGDGDALIAGTKDIRSFAPIEDAPFLSSHEPSLYDLFDDTYDEPVKVSDNDRAIPLPKEMGAQQKEHHLARSQQAGRQFSTLREVKNPKKGKIRDRESSALLYLKGRTPLHLKLEAYQAYDGVEWHPDSLTGREPNLSIETLHGRPWLQIPEAVGPELFAPPESHALQIIHLDTNHIPAPVQLLGVHIDLLDRIDFYGWAQPGILRMQREKLPSQTAIHLQTRGIRWNRLPDASLLLTGRPEVYQQFGQDFHSQQVRELAERWTAGIPRGWQQVQAVVDRLKQDYIRDDLARPPQDCRHTVAHFLLEARRGPDYQFASATVWLLRSLGYSCRLVSGFYASPDDYDPRSRQTPVRADDVHFWAEVYAGRDHWIPVEPTPGYELLSPPLTFSEQLQVALGSLIQFAGNNWWSLLLCSLVATSVGYHRSYLADRLAALRWRLLLPHAPRRFVLQTQRLLEHRLRRAGLTKPQGMTLSRWLTHCSRARPDLRFSDAASISRLFDWAVYAPVDSPCPCPHWLTLCRQLEQDWCRSKLMRRPADRGQTLSAVRQPRTLKPSWFPTHGIAG